MTRIMGALPPPFLGRSCVKSRECVPDWYPTWELGPLDQAFLGHDALLWRASECHIIGASQARFYRRTMVYGGLRPPEARRSKQFEEENARLPRLVINPARFTPTRRERPRSLIKTSWAHAAGRLRKDCVQGVCPVSAPRDSGSMRHLSPCRAAIAAECPKATQVQTARNEGEWRVATCYPAPDNRGVVAKLQPANFPCPEKTCAFRRNHILYHISAHLPLSEVFSARNRPAKLRPQNRES